MGGASSAHFIFLKFDGLRIWRVCTDTQTEIKFLMQTDGVYFVNLKVELQLSEFQTFQFADHPNRF